MIGDDAYDAIAARALAGPLSAEDTGALLVHADLLQHAGDPRGELIALEVADRRADRRRDLRAAINKHLATRCADLVGDAAPLLLVPRLVTLELRAGQLYGVTIDARLAKAADAAPADVLRRVLAMPLARTLRRLRYHVLRFEWNTQPETVLNAASELALEELDVGSHGRSAPSRRMVYGQEAWRQPYQPALDSLWTRFAGLWWWTFYGDLYVPARPPDDTGALAATDRVRLGRALVRPETHTDALARIAALGERGAPFVRGLVAMTSPGVVSWIDPIARTLAAIGAGAAPALPRLARIAGDVRHPAMTRRVCGGAVHAITTALAARGM